MPVFLKPFRSFLEIARRRLAQLDGTRFQSSSTCSVEPNKFEIPAKVTQKCLCNIVELTAIFCDPFFETFHFPRLRNQVASTPDANVE